MKYSTSWKKTNKNFKQIDETVITLTLLNFSLISVFFVKRVQCSTAVADHRSGGTYDTISEKADEKEESQEEAENDFDEEDNELSSLYFEEDDV
jgi:hypothetical protein